MFSKIISTLFLVIFFSYNLMAVNKLEKNTNVCGSSIGFGINYMMENNAQSYSWGFYMFDNFKIEARNLKPHVRNIYFQGGQILLDSCNICRPFYQYDGVAKLHKYILEIRKPFGNLSTIALEYGSIIVSDTLLGTNSLRAAYSYFLDLSLPDTIAAQYSPNEIIYSHLFTDANNNSLYEIKYNGNVVGIKYYCNNNSQEYIRYFISKN